MTSGADRPNLADVSHIGFSVTNLERSIRFYCDVLGAPLVSAPTSGDNPSFSGRMAVVFLGGHALDLFEHASNEGERFKPARTGLDHFALMAESSENLHAWARWLDSCDVPRSAIREVAGIGALFDFVDPDGIQLEFFFLDPVKLQQSAEYSDFAEPS